jgi:cell division transport system ATP-binding protein
MMTPAMTTATTTMVQFEHVGLRHATGADVGSEVLSEVTVSLHAGVFYLLTGPGGAGKSALLDLLSLARAPDRGTLHLFGEEVNRLTRDRLAACRRRIGIVHRDGRLLPHLTAAQNVALPLRIADEAPVAIDRAVAAMLDRVGMADRADALPAALSAGERQRIAVARAFVARPALVVADEPTGAIDPAAADRLLVLLGSLGDAATTVVMATHDSRLFTRLPRARILRLDHGRLHDPAAPAPVPRPGPPPHAAAPVTA